MRHPFDELRPEYESLLATMRVQRTLSVDHEAQRVLQPHTGNLEFALEVQDRSGNRVPAAFILALDNRESGCDPARALGQGDYWNKISTHVPRGMGPFESRVDAALFYLHYDHLDDRIGTWTWALACWKAEAWNGFGPRAHGIHSGYLWAGTNHYVRGKYVADGEWDADHVDQQIGVIPLMRRLVALEPRIKFDDGVLHDHAALSPKPAQPPVGVAGFGLHDVKSLQAALNALMPDCELMPLALDGSYGRRTREAVREFQHRHGLKEDGLFGPLTYATLKDQSGVNVA